ncbi:MAG: AAA family ATPase [Gemmatimonadota bacterium]|nr:AAA family ATPase [Gemmatimonadota bacterium]
MSDQSAPTIRKFNPGLLQSDEEISKQFVVRHHELGLLLDDLRGNIGSPSCQHMLVVGPRGRGKTMLLARVAAELRSNEEFAGSLLPVRFMEESQEIFSLTDFWLETMFHLANEIDEHDAAVARELRDTRDALAPRWREQITEAHARAAVLNAADRLDKQLVLIVENLQSLFRDTHDDFGWQLREVLQTEPQIILLASATSRFRELDDVSEPFFEMFRIVELKPLDTEECGRLWEVVSGKPAFRSEVRPLQILTGGNPRLLVMAAEFARHRSLRRLMSELVTMIDEHTEYFRGHLEALAKTERRVYVAVIDLWQPSSASEVAARARVDIRVASTMLGRLVERGAVLRQGRGRKRLYSAAEPLYSMYYKLRRERDEAAVVENLIRFMVACYALEDMLMSSDALATEAAESDAIRRGMGRALRHWTQLAPGSYGQSAPDDVLLDVKWSVIREASTRAWSNAEAAATKEFQDAVEAAFKEHAFERVPKLVEDYVAAGWTSVYESRSDSRTAWTTYLLVAAHAQLGNASAVLEHSHQVLGFADSRDVTTLAWTAPTLALRARAQRDLGAVTAAIAACDDLIQRFGSWEDPQFEAVIAHALCTRGCSRALLGDDQGAIRDYDEVADRFGDCQLPEIQASLVAALMSRGLACRRLGDREEEIRSYDAVIERFESSDVLDLRWEAAVALGWKCMAQADMGLADQALASCRRLEEVVRSWPGNEQHPSAGSRVEWLKWRAEGARSLAFAVHEDHRASLDSFQAAYVSFSANDDVTTREMLDLVARLVTRGVPSHDLLAVFSSDTAKAESLRPLVVALHHRAGDPIRAPREVEEVAADIRERFHKAEAR